MAESIETVLPLSKTIYDQAEHLAKQLNLSQADLMQIALERFISFHAAGSGEQQMPDDSLRINQGDIYWIQPDNSANTALGYYPHPYVVIQDNLLNHGRIHTVVVCALTTNLKQADLPGNVLLEVGEANLPQQSAVVVSKVSAVLKAQLGKYIGSLNEVRIQQITAGLRFLQSSYYR